MRMRWCWFRFSMERRGIYYGQVDYRRRMGDDGLGGSRPRGRMVIGGWIIGHRMRTTERRWSWLQMADSLVFEWMRSLVVEGAVTGVDGG
ncbi:hypothetical protein L6452_20928 [Arctium lappa]|uniref:Uncharacterized protein n=1 Tax=Arctium lappa TaxID=4217 RepID=A0ACB9BCQ9_ARCLA|nr:hypothetical protein L6452_20928 [Arctium lappa]